MKPWFNQLPKLGLNILKTVILYAFIAFVLWGIWAVCQLDKLTTVTVEYWHFLGILLILFVIRGIFYTKSNEKEPIHRPYDRMNKIIK